MDLLLERAKNKYKLLLKQFKNMSNVSDKDYERTYYKLSGMESILESFHVDITQIQKEVYDNIK